MAEEKFEPFKTKEELLEKFKDKMSSLGFISDLTGAILTDPIFIDGSSDPVEREFIEQSIRTTRKNPFTRKPMTLEEINTMTSDENAKNRIQGVKKAIENEITNFLEENKDHQDFEAIKLAVEKERYQPTTRPSTAAQPQANQPSDPTADDILAMQQAAGMRAFQAQQAQASEEEPVPIARAGAPRRTLVHFDNWELIHD